MLQMGTLGADETGIERARHRYIGRALDDRSTIREKCKCVWLPLKSKQQVIESNPSVGRETVTHRSEVDGAVMLVNLNGVSSAKRYVRPIFATEMSELAMIAHRASLAGPGRGDL